MSEANRAPELAGHFGALLPSDIQARRALYAGKHPAFADPDAPFGLDAACVAAAGTTPLVVIAMLRKQGGLAGRGLYRPPASIFG